MCGVLGWGEHCTANGKGEEGCDGDVPRVDAGGPGCGAVVVVVGGGVKMWCSAVGVVVVDVEQWAL